MSLKRRTLTLSLTGVILVQLCGLGLILIYNISIPEPNIHLNNVEDSWVISLGQEENSIAFDNDSNIYLSLIEKEEYYDSYGMLRLMKINSSGQILWNKAIRNNTHQVSIVMGSDDYLYVGGAYNNNSVNYMFLIKLNSSGDAQWEVSWEKRWTWLNGLCINSQDDVFLYCTTQFYYDYHNEITLFKYNKSGGLIWSREYKAYLTKYGDNSSEFGLDIGINFNDDIIISGKSITTQISWIRYLNKTGDQMWNVTSYERLEYNFKMIEIDSNDIIISYNKGYLVKYNSQGTLVGKYKLKYGLARMDLDTEGNVYHFYEIAAYLPLDIDVAIGKYNHLGQHQRIITWGSSGRESPISMVIDRFNNIYIILEYWEHPYGGSGPDEVFLIKNPVTNGKLYYEDTVFIFYLISFGFFGLISVVVAILIIKKRK